MTKSANRDKVSIDETPYFLNHQVGFHLRRATQRHTSIFAELMLDDLTPTRFAALAKLNEVGSLSQNQLGRLTSMDIATIKGVVDRLRDRNLVVTEKDPHDGRRQLVSLTQNGREMITRAIPMAISVTKETLNPLTKAEAKLLSSLLEKIS